MLNTISILYSLLPLALASPLAPRQTADNPPSAFGLIAARSGSPIHLEGVNASGQAFWIGKETATYCPLTDQTLCPSGTETVLVGGGYAMVSFILVPFLFASEKGALVNNNRTVADILR